MKLRRFGILSLLLILLAGTLFPLLWMFYSSLLAKTTTLGNAAEVFKQGLTLKNYLEVFSRAPFERFFFNSISVAAIVTLGNLIFCSMAGYAFARKSFPLKRSIFISVILVLMVPVHVLIIPLYLLMSKL